MTSQAEAQAQVDTARSGLWAAIALSAALLGFIVGYAVSARTGIEPGYFEAAEAGGYGVPASAKPKASEDLQKYYENLLK